jgi:hypothetical protein
MAKMIIDDLRLSTSHFTITQGILAHENHPNPPLSTIHRHPAPVCVPGSKKSPQDIQELCSHDEFAFSSPPMADHTT